MPQLNIYLPPSDPLKVRLDEAATRLQTTPNTLARLVVDEFLETYVSVAAEADTLKRRTFHEVHERLRSRAAAAEPAPGEPRLGQRVVVRRTPVLEL
jgi:hypothetical protein